MRPVPQAGVIREWFNQGFSYLEIAERLNLTKGVIAGRCRRLGLVRPNSRQYGISPEEQAERAMDERDLDILADIAEGHSTGQTAKHWGVTKSFIEHLKHHAMAAQ